MSFEIKNLSKVFTQGSGSISVLKDLNLNVKKSETVAILGHSGSGKSTLLSLIAGLEKPTQGEISIEGTNICDLPEKQMTEFRSRKISIVFQQFHLITHLNALENVMLPLEILDRQGTALEKANLLLSELGLSERLKHFPSQLSGGECQRVAIARALVVEPTILLADEPSGNLDSETGRYVMEAFFKSIREHKTMTLLVTHNENIARQCDRILLLKNGSFVQAFL